MLYVFYRGLNVFHTRPRDFCQRSFRAIFSPDRPDALFTSRSRRRRRRRRLRLRRAARGQKASSVHDAVARNDRIVFVPYRVVYVTAHTVS